MRFLSISMTCALLAAGQLSAAPPSKAASNAQQGIALAAKHQCDAALPLLNELIPAIADKQLRYDALLATARCGIQKKDGKLAVNTIMALRHDYPEDPEVLYLTTQVFLKIAVQASQDLEKLAPRSHQLAQLKAESLEQQEKWDEAAALYRRILDEDPKHPEMHMRLGRILLSQAKTLADNDEAAKQFQEELAVDPASAPAEFWLGEVSRVNGRFAEAIAHFSTAIKMNGDFAPSFLTLGMTYSSTERFEDAVGPLERYTKLAPADPAGHFQLARVYARVGRKEDSEREMAAQRELLEKAKMTPGPPTATLPY